MPCRIVFVTGTPGTGKTTVAKLLAEKTGYEYIDLNAILLSRYKLDYDPEAETWDVDVEKAVRDVELPEKCVIDGHLSHHFPVDIVIVLRCRPNVLRERLREKGWNEQKIKENVEAEAINVIGEEARWDNDRVFEIDTTSLSPEKVVEEAVKILNGSGKSVMYDFLEDLFKEV